MENNLNIYNDSSYGQFVAIDTNNLNYLLQEEENWGQFVEIDINDKNLKYIYDRKLKNIYYKKINNTYDKELISYDNKNTNILLGLFMRISFASIFTFGFSCFIFFML